MMIIVFLILYGIFVPILANLIVFIVLFGVFCFLIYRLFRLRFKLSKKIIIFSIIISFIIVRILLSFFIWGCGRNNYTIPIEVHVTSLSNDKQEPLDSLIELDYAGKSFGIKHFVALRHVMKNPSISFYLEEFGCLDLSKEYRPSPFPMDPLTDSYLRTKEFCSGSGAHGLLDQKSDVVEINQKGEQVFIREVSYYRPEQKFYDEGNLPDLYTLWEDSATHERYFKIDGIRYESELVRERYEIRVEVPWFGEFRKGASCEIM